MHYHDPERLKDQRGKRRSYVHGALSEHKRAERLRPDRRKILRKKTGSPVD